MHQSLNGYAVRFRSVPGVSYKLDISKKGNALRWHPDNITNPLQLASFSTEEQ